MDEIAVTPRKVMLTIVSRSLNARTAVGMWVLECYATADQTAIIYGVNVVSAEPAPVARNKAVRQAREHGLQGADILIMVDDDMLPASGWYARVLQVLRDHPGATASGSPYCGIAPEHLVMVQRPDGKRYGRDESASQQNVGQVACIGTGLFACNMAAFDAVETAGLLPFFDYEYEDTHHTVVSCTEDFFFCRRLNEAGGKVFCDWECWSGHAKVEVVGKPDKPFDYSFVRTEPVPLPKPIPTTIRGYMWPQELLWLYDQARKLEQDGVEGELLEVGSFCGLSAAALGQAGSLLCVDTFAGGGDMPVHESFDEFTANMNLMGLEPDVYREGSDSALLSLDGNLFRLILIDGGHEYQQVKTDLANAWRLLAPGGLLVVDDYTYPTPTPATLKQGRFPSVAVACDEFARGLGMRFAAVERSKMGYLSKLEKQAATNCNGRVLEGVTRV